MTLEEFNKKYNKYIENGFYGLAINSEDIIDYLDQEFENEIIENPDFEYSQIKLKFGMARVYTSSKKNRRWESQINKILKVNP